MISSDVYLTSERKEIFGPSPSEELRMANHTALRNHPDSQLIVFSGDSAHEGAVETNKSFKKITEKKTHQRLF